MREIRKKQSRKWLPLTIMVFLLGIFLVGCDSDFFKRGSVTYTVNFYVDDVLVKTEQVRPWANATPPSVPEKPGYIFVGWSASYNEIQKSLDIYALFEEIVYHTVAFYLNDTLINQVSVAHGENVIPPKVDVLPGYQFIAWDKQLDNITEDLEVKAIIETIDYTITYLNEGNPVDNPTSYTVEDTITLNNPTKTHHAFLGWYLNGEKIATINPGTIGNLVLEARYEFIGTALEITQMPSKTTYLAFEEVDLAGMIVSIIYRDGSKAVVSDFEVDKTILLATDTSLTIAYLGLEVTLPITVNKRTIDLSGVSFSDEVKTYNGLMQSIALQGELPSGVSVSYSTGFVDVGSYEIIATFTVTDSVNYEVPSPMKATLSIQKAPLEVKVVDTTMKVGSMLPTFNVTYHGFVNNETIDVLTGAISFVTEVSNNTPAGIYDVNAQGLIAKNYEIIYTLGKLTVEPIAFNIKANQLETVYNGQKQMFSAFAYDGETRYENITIKYYLNGEVFAGAVNAGEYVVVAKFNDPTFGQGETSFTFVIKKATIESFIIPDAQFVYDGKPHSLSVTNLPSGITNVTYSANNQLTNVGSIIVTVSFTVDANHEAVASQEVKLTVLPKTLDLTMVKPINNQKYNGNPITPLVILNYQNMELVEGRDFEVTYIDNIELGIAKVTIKAVDGSNYQGTITTTFMIIGEAFDYALTDQAALENEYASILTGSLTRIPFLRLQGEIYSSSIFWMSDHTAVSVNSLTGEVTITPTDVPIEVELYAIIMQGIDAQVISSFKFIVLPLN